MAGAGELGQLQAQAMRAGTGPQPIQACLAALAMRQSTVKAQECTDAELKLAQAQALGSPVEYRRWLSTYARTLARAYSLPVPDQGSQAVHDEQAKIS